MNFICVIRCDVDDETEALAIRTVVDAAMIPFAELKPTVHSECKVPIEPPEPPT